MITYLFEEFKQSKAIKALFLLFIGLTIWWITIYLRGLESGSENNAFTLIYPIFSLLGGVAGFSFAMRWGGFKSVLGRSIMMFTLGILSQFIGQVLYAYYIYVLGIEVPYPSLGDIPYFASILFYIYGVVLLAKVSGLKLSLSTYQGKIKAVLIPIGVFIGMYLVLLNGYEPDWANKITVFLDFAYPIGQAMYLSIAILAFLVSKHILGGIMRSPILLLILALISQYVADFYFGYEISIETWYIAGTSDYLFCLAYFLMALAIFSIGNMFYKVQES